LSDSPGLAAVEPADHGRWSTFAGPEAKPQWEGLAGQDGRIVGSRDPDELEPTVEQSVEFQSPGVAIENQELTRVDLGVEVELAPGEIIFAEDLDGKIGTSAVMGAAVLGGVVSEIDADVGFSIVRLPILDTVAEIVTIKGESTPREGEDLAKDHTEFLSEDLVFHVRER
jgi:hypothetical protein